MRNRRDGGDSFWLFRFGCISPKDQKEVTFAASCEYTMEKALNIWVATLS